ncbi:MFS transporter [Streptomyces sp. MZ04]|uniref:MFS transporter n=1 Tax=Streptomyces sp. MZ04 TaxID=2559236 RepID=UPI00107E8C5E|nr:MFS transporter [Streptomyces sp. MZ04]TGB13372.1 MFS transporter [Streptomyces sp. MZ04]
MATPNAAAAAEPASGPVADPKRWLVLAVVCTAYLMVGLDLTVMNLALPSAQEDLGFTDADRQWIVTAYALPFGSLLLFCGRLSDLIGRKESFLIGVGGFSAASAVGGAANSFEMLVTARAFQGAFAAMLAPTVLAVVATQFIDQKEKNKAFGIFSAVASSGAALGLIIGGALTTSLDWRWCMYVNLVFGVTALIGGQLLMQKQPRPGAKMDVPGVLVASAGMFCVVYGFSNAAENSWSTPSTWGVLAAGGVLLVIFAAWQTRAANPLLPPRIVLDRNRGAAYLTVLLVGIGMFGVMLFLIYFMQNNLGYSAITSGSALLPMIVFTTVAAGIGAIRLLPLFGPKPLISTGMVMSAAGMAWLTRIDADASYVVDLLGPLVVIGAGMGLIYSASSRTGTSGVAPQEAGIASACINTGQQLGGAVGTALLNTIAATAATGWLDSNVQGKPSPEQLGIAAIDGYTTVFWWCTAIFTFGAVIAAVLLRGGPLPVPAEAAAQKPEQAEAAQS